MSLSVYPGRQGFGCAGSLQESAALRHHAEVWCGPAGGCGRAGRGHAVAGRPEQHVANGRARIAPQLRLGGALLLEIELIELRILGARHQACRRRLAARPERHAERCDRPEAVGPHERGLPGDAGAPIMPDDDGGRRTQGIENADHVADKMQDRVLVDRLRRVALAVAAHIGGDNTEAGGSKRVDLMPPREPGFRKTVHQQHQRPLALLGDVDVDAVAFDDALRCLAHFSIALRSCSECVDGSASAAIRHASGASAAASS